MLDRELMDIAPEAPLSRGGAWRLAQGSLPATRCASGRPVPFCVAGGRATGSIAPAAGQDDLAGHWVCAIGACDGLHRGHQELLRRHGYYHDLYSKQFAEESAARILQ